jgi:hypothetical protein
MLAFEEIALIKEMIPNVITKYSTFIVSDEIEIQKK